MILTRLFNLSKHLSPEFKYVSLVMAEKSFLALGQAISERKEQLCFALCHVITSAFDDSEDLRLLDEFCLDLLHSNQRSLSKKLCHLVLKHKESTLSKEPAWTIWNYLTIAEVKMR